MATKKRRRARTNAVTLEDEYRTIAPLAARFADEVAHQLDRLLEDNGVYVSFPVQKRVKEWPSIAEKLERKALALQAIKDLTDLVGLRIILQFRRDVDRVCDAIRSHFSVLEQYDTADRLSADQFGYSSFHFIVGLPEAWLAVPTLSTLRGFRAEIQVRTTAQHIWAAASHSLQYKQEDAVPPPLRRAIHRVSALLETVDLEFERVLSDRDIYKSAAADLPPSERLNADLLSSTMDELLPPLNKKPGEEPYAELLPDLEAFGVTTRGQLSSLLRKHMAAILQKDAERVDEHRAHPTLITTFGGNPERIASGVFYSHVGLVRMAIEAEHGDKWKAYSLAKRTKRSPRKPITPPG